MIGVLDVMTTFRVSALLYVLMALTTFAMLHRKVERSLWVWCLAGLLSGGSVWLITLRGVINDAWTYVIAQPMLFSAYLAYGQALRLSMGRGWRYQSLLAVVVVFIAAMVVGFDYRQHWIMAFFVRCANSMALVALTVLAVQLWKGERSKNALLITVGFGLFTSCMILNAGITWYAKGTLQALQVLTINHVMGLMSIFTLLITHMGFLGLALQRIQQINAQLRNAQQQAQRKREHMHALALFDRQRTLAVLADSLGHGIVQPLTSTLLNLGLAMRISQLDGGEVSAAKNLLQAVVDGLQRGTEMVERIQQFLRPQTGTSSCFSLQAVIQDCLDLLRQDIILRGIELQVTLPVAPVRVQAESLALTQALLHVLRNAMQALEQCSIKWIHLTLKEYDLACIEITDSGAGFSAEQLIQAAYGAQQLTDWSVGLGLYMTQAIVADCGGSLKLQNSQTGGASVSILIPTVRDASPS